MRIGRGKEERGEEEKEEEEREGDGRRLEIMSHKTNMSYHNDLLWYT